MGDFNRGGDGGRRFGRGGRDFNRGPKEMFHAVCDNCGKDCEVPFKPTGNKPVYCSDCFSKMGGRGEPRRNRDHSEGHGNGRDIQEINAKLDKILEILSPGVKTTANPQPPVENSMPKEKPPKKKRTPKKEVAAPAEEIIVEEETPPQVPVVKESQIIEETPVVPEEKPAE